MYVLVKSSFFVLSTATLLRVLCLMYKPEDITILSNGSKDVWPTGFLSLFFRIAFGVLVIFGSIWLLVFWVAYGVEVPDCLADNDPVFDDLHDILKAIFFLELAPFYFIGLVLLFLSCVGIMYGIIIFQDGRGESLEQEIQPIDR